MMSLKLSTAAFLLAFLFAMPVQSEQSAETMTTEKTGTLKNQTHCPVMGGEIDSTVYTDIQGQRVYHCCPGCSERLKADPDKFFKKAAAEGVLFENIQTACPVSGMDLDKTVFIDYEGRRILFCSDKCRDTFTGDPNKYLSMMDKPAADKDKDGHEAHGDHGHSGHGH
jgi:YHS domain-containing protein